MKAMILAAGLGTRLRPLTLNKPKALVPVGNTPVVERLIQYLKGHGITEIIVNTHHQHKQVVNYLDRGRAFGIKIEVRVEPEILGTGGGVKNTEDFWDAEPFVLINGDILTDIDLARACKTHQNSGNLATLILHDHNPYNQIKIDNRSNIVDIAAERHSGRLAFTGIHIVQPQLLDYIPEGVFFNIIDCYRDLIRQGKPIGAHISKGHYWRDIGTIADYFLVNREMLKENPFLLAPDCRIHNSVKLKDWAIIGQKAYLEEGVEITRSILWENVRVKSKRKIIDSIVTSSKEVQSDLLDKIF